MTLTYREFLKEESKRYKEFIQSDIQSLVSLYEKGESTLTKEYTDLIVESSKFIENYGVYTIDFHDGLTKTLDTLENNNMNLELIKILASIHRKLSNSINVIAHKIKDYERDLY